MAITTFMDNLEEFVSDPQQIVSYKWLSLKLGIPFNRAKQMLFGFVQQNASKPQSQELHVVYMLGGSVVKNGQRGRAIRLVYGPDLESARKSFAEISTEHVYSVQKYQPKDVGAALYTADYDIQKSNLDTIPTLRGIKCAKAVRAAGRERKVAEVSIDEPLPPLPPVLTKKPSGKTTTAADFFKQSGKKKKESRARPDKTATAKPADEKPAKKATKQETAFNKMFGAPAKKPTKKKKLKSLVESRTVEEPSDDEDEQTEVPQKKRSGSKKRRAVLESDSEDESEAEAETAPAEEASPAAATKPEEADEEAVDEAPAATSSKEAEPEPASAPEPEPAPGEREVAEAASPPASAITVHSGSDSSGQAGQAGEDGVPAATVAAAEKEEESKAPGSPAKKGVAHGEARPKAASPKKRKAAPTVLAEKKKAKTDTSAEDPVTPEEPAAVAAPEERAEEAEAAEPAKPRKRKKKVIRDKVVNTIENGYMATTIIKEEVEIEVTDDEEEQQRPRKKAALAPAGPGKKAAAPGKAKKKKKQGNLMGFFSKKKS